MIKSGTVDIEALLAKTVGNIVFGRIFTIFEVDILLIRLKVI